MEKQEDIKEKMDTVALEKMQMVRRGEDREDEKEVRRW